MKRRRDSSPVEIALDQVHAMPYGKNMELRIHVGTYAGRHVLSARVWCPGKGSTELRPTGKGFMIDAAKAPELLAGMQAALQAVQATPARAKGAAGAESR